MINLEGTDHCREYNIVQENMKVLELKGHLSKIYKIPVNQMDILLNDFPLNDKQVLNQVGVGDNLLIIRKKNPNNPNQNISSSQQFITPQSPNLASSNVYLGGNLANSNVLLGPNQILTNSNRNIPQNQNIVSSNRNIIQNQNLTTSNRNISQNQILANSNRNINQNSNIRPNNQITNTNANNPLGLSQSSLLNDALAYNDLLGISQSSPEAQRRIENIIQQQRINDNFRHAAEFMPESLIPVPMLFINVEINNKKCAALVDTGAQSTFMSLDLCTRCGLMNLVDKRFQGIARGVGASRIVGVIHAAQIKIMNKMIATKINVIENNEVGLVFGLDSLRAHRCNVDLKKNGLVFPDIGITAPFLSDGEIKKMKEQRVEDEENDEIERAKIESLNYV